LPSHVQKFRGTRTPSSVVDKFMCVGLSTGTLKNCPRSSSIAFYIVWWHNNLPGDRHQLDGEILHRTRSAAQSLSDGSMSLIHLRAAAEKNSSFPTVMNVLRRRCCRFCYSDAIYQCHDTLYHVNDITSWFTSFITR